MREKIYIYLIQELESMAANHVDGKSHLDPAAQEFKREISQLEQQLHAQLASEKKTKEKNTMSVRLIKEFLIQQVKKHLWKMKLFSFYQ